MTQFKLNLDSRFFRRLVGILIALIGVTLAIRYTYSDLGELISDGIQIDPSKIAFAALIQAIGLVFSILTWGSIARGFDVDATTREHFRIYLYSSLGWIIPGGIWDIIMRSSLYSGRNYSAEQVAAASLVERIIIGISALSLYVLTLLYRPELNAFERPGLAIILSLLLLFSIQPKMFNRIYRYLVRLSGDRLSDFSINFRSGNIIRWLVIEGVILVLGGSSLYLLLESLQNTAFTALPFVISAWAAATAASNLFFWLPGTLIFHDGLFVLVISSIVSVPTAILFAFFVRIWTTVSLLLFAAFAWVVIDLIGKLIDSSG